MNDSKGVFTSATQQEQSDALSKSASAQLDRAKQYNQNASAENQSTYVQAQVEFFVTIDGNRGSCYGWIYYLDGRRLRFYGEANSAVGGPVNMKTNQLIPTWVLPYEQLASNPAHFEANGRGIGSGGELFMTSLKVPVTPYPLQLTGGAIISWQTEGVGDFVTN